MEEIELIKVLLVVDDDVIDRFGCVLRHLCVGMMDEPVRVTVLAKSQRNIDDVVGPARVVRVPRALWPWHRWDAQELLEEFEVEAPDVVHCFSPPLFTWVRPWAAAWGSLGALHLTDMLDVERFAQLQVTGGVTAISVTPSIERSLMELRPDLRDWSRMIPVGMTAQAEASCLAEPDRTPAAVVTAPLTGGSGVERVLRALQMVVRSGQEVQLFLLSSGPAERSLRRLAEQLGVVQHVTFAGQMRDWSFLEDALRGADFYLMPGIPPRFTAVRLSAIASGLAIIAPTGTTEDYLIDGTTARLFECSDDHQFAETWLHLLDDRTAARQLAETALDYARAHHQASTMATAIAWLYREMLQTVPAGKRLADFV